MTQLRSQASDPISAALFPLRIANGSANDLLAGLPAYALCAHAEPRALVAAAPAFDHVVTNVDLKAVEALVESLPDTVEAIVGLGGGQAIDNAKFLAWRAGLPLYQLPTIMSVDAPFTEEVGIRAAGRVRYVGSVRPVEVVVDPTLVRRRPHRSIGRAWRRSSPVTRRRGTGRTRASADSVSRGTSAMWSSGVSSSSSSPALPRTSRRSRTTAYASSPVPCSASVPGAPRRAIRVSRRARSTRSLMSLSG